MSKTTRAIFIRTGWMVWYDHDKEPNGPSGGGAYNVDNVGSEANSFCSWRGRVYGYAQTPSGGLNLSRVSGGDGLMEIDGVLVLTYATAPGRPGQRLVGWYSDSVCFGQHQGDRPGNLYGIWNFRAETKRAVLLPLDARDRCAPKRGDGGFGQSNIRYALTEKGEDAILPWMRRDIEFVLAYDGPSLLTGADPGGLMETPPSEASGQGWHSDPEARRAVETRAMEVAVAFFRGRGYAVDPEVHRYQPFDLFCVDRETGDSLRVEVKGSTLDVEEIFLTANEIASARETELPTALFVVSSITLRRTRRGLRASGGVARWLAQWSPTERRLRPIQFRYRIPKMDLAED